MSAPLLLVVSVLGGLGAVARVVLAGSIAPHVQRYPFVAILTVNLLGSLALGILFGLALHDRVGLIVGTGFLGGFTTFSTWMVEIVIDADRKRRAASVTNLVVSLIGGLALAGAGWALGAAIAGAL